jgi:hypothetical protein
MTGKAENENLKLLRETWELAPPGPEKDEAYKNYQKELSKTGGNAAQLADETQLEKAVDALK